MADRMTLEPYAARVLWRAETAFSSEEWRALLVGFVEELARRAVEKGAVLVGHIKGIARPEAGGYLHVSAVSAGHPATAQGQLPDGLEEVALDLAVLVYGLPRDTVGSVVDEAAGAHGRSWNCSVFVETTESRAHFDGLHSLENSR